MPTTIRSALAGLSLVLAVGVSGALAQSSPTGSPPLAQPFRIGTLFAWSLHDGQFQPANNGSTFGLGEPPATVADVLRKAGAPTDRVFLSVNDLLVKSTGHIMLFDTGLGPKMHGGLMGSLALAGVRPGDVTDILITHSHGDHVGGLVTADRQLAFPNATIRMSTREWTWMRSQPNGSGLATVIAPKVVSFEPGSPVLPGVTPLAIPGHTPGHVGYWIISGGARLLDFGDTAHSYIISLARPDWKIEFDTDQTVGAQTRRAELERLAASHERVFAPHFPFPGLGEVVKSGDGFVWKSEVTKIAVGGPPK